jgi:hypothetical protein
MARNPFFDPKAPAVPAAVLDKARRVLATHLRAPGAAALIPDAVLRATTPALADDAVWAAVQRDLGL